jgi:hypothetical protein
MKRTKALRTSSILSIVTAATVVGITTGITKKTMATKVVAKARRKRYENMSAPNKNAANESLISH